jgi:hypothetical protein
MATSIASSVSVDLGSNLIKIIVTDRQGAISTVVSAPNNLGFVIPTKPQEIDSLATLLKGTFNQYKLPKKKPPLEPTRALSFYSSY